MSFLAANGGTILVCLILAVLVGLVVYKMVADRKRGISACDSCVSADSCSIHASGKSCGNPHDKVADMEPQIKKVK